MEFSLWDGRMGFVPGEGKPAAHAPVSPVMTTPGPLVGLHTEAARGSLSPETVAHSILLAGVRGA